MITAHILGAAGDGGAEQFFERLLPALTLCGDQVVPVIRTNPARAARLAAAGLTPTQLGFGGPLDLYTRPRLRRVLERAAPAVVVTWMGRAATHTPTGPWVLAGRLGGYYDLRRFRHCTHLIANTQPIARWILAQGWATERVHLLPNFAPDLAAAPPVRLDVPPGAPLLLAAGRLHPVKGFDLLLRALARLPGVYLIIAGEGPERAALTTLATKLGVADRLRLPGWRRDMAGLLAGCDVFVCPSRKEPLGNVVIEAFAAARPVVAADAEGPSALITPGINGLLVPRQDPTALAEAIDALLQSPAEAATIARAGRESWATTYAQAPVLAKWRTTLARMVAS